MRYTLRTESESLELANNGTFRWFQRRTELILMRAYCPAQGFVVIEADLANSYIEYYSERTGQANTYVRTQPHPFVPGSRFRSPGNSPLVTDGGDPRPCVESFFDGTYNVSRNLVSRCQDGSYLETRQSIFDAQYSRTEYVWSWVTSIECDRPPGPGLLPPGLDPLTLRPVVPGCPGCGA